MKVKETLLFSALVLGMVAACSKTEYDTGNMVKQVDILQNTRIKTDSISKSISTDTLLQDIFDLTEEQLHALLQYDDTGWFYNLAGFPMPYEFSDIYEYIDMSTFRQMVSGKKYDIDTLVACGSAINMLPVSLDVSLYDQEDTIHIDIFDEEEISMTLTNIRNIDSLCVCLSGVYDGKYRIRPEQKLSVMITSAVAESGITFKEEKK